MSSSDSEENSTYLVFLLSTFKGGVGDFDADWLESKEANLSFLIFLNFAPLGLISIVTFFLC